MTMEDRFEKKFKAVNDCSTRPVKHWPGCQGCIRIIIEEPEPIKAFIKAELAKRDKKWREKCVKAKKLLPTHKGKMLSRTEVKKVLDSLLERKYEK